MEFSEFSTFNDDITDLDIESPDIHGQPKDMKSYLWPNNDDNINTTPLIDKDWLEGFSNDQIRGEAKLVSSEEDLISPMIPQKVLNSSNNSDSNRNLFDSNNYEVKNGQHSTLFEANEFENLEIITPNNRYISNKKENYLQSDNFNVDGFASNDIITIGGSNDDDVGEDRYTTDEQAQDERTDTSIADIWDNSQYNTVVRNNQPKATELSDIKKEIVLGSINGRSSKKIDTGDSEDNQCYSCSTRVYITERLVIDNSLYHKQCFKCTKCRRLLSINNFASCGKRLFCQTHFIELFRQKDDESQHSPMNGSQGNVTNAENINNYQDSVDATVEPVESMKNIMERFKKLESTPNNGGNKKSIKKSYELSSQSLKYSRNQRNNSLENYAVAKTTDDVTETDELPVPGSTRNLLSLWANMSGHVSNTMPTSRHATPSKPANSSISHPQALAAFSNTKSKSITSDVVKHDDILEDNLPAPQTAKCVAAKFRELERNNYQPPLPSNNSKLRNKQPSSTNPQLKNDSNTKRISMSNNNNQSSNRLQHTSSLESAQVIPSTESVEVTEEFPEAGTTKNLVGFFKAIQKNNH